MQKILPFSSYSIPLELGLKNWWGNRTKRPGHTCVPFRFSKVLEVNQTSTNKLLGKQISTQYKDSVGIVCHRSRLGLFTVDKCQMLGSSGQRYTFIGEPFFFPSLKALRSALLFEGYPVFRIDRVASIQ